VVHHHTYNTGVVLGLDNNQSDYYVYTPPGYNAKAKKAYPVMYLLHGWSDDASGWTAVGQAHLILDNLLAQGKVKPMVVVMPLGYGDMSFVHDHDVWNQAATVDHNVSLLPGAERVGLGIASAALCWRGGTRLTIKIPGRSTMGSSQDVTKPVTGTIIQSVMWSS